jgi:hypothetical protein
MRACVRPCTDRLLGSAAVLIAWVIVQVPDGGAQRMFSFSARSRHNMGKGDPAKVPKCRGIVLSSARTQKQNETNNQSCMHGVAGKFLHAVKNGFKFTVNYRVTVPHKSHHTRSGSSQIG